MTKETKELKTIFNNIKQKGWIKNYKNGDGSAGEIFENIIGIKNNNLCLPDYKGIEIKTKRIGAKNRYITLFSYETTSNSNNDANRLKELIGYPINDRIKTKILKCVVFANKYTIINNKYKLKLCIKDNRIYLNIYSIDNILIDNNSYWKLNVLQEKLYKKLQSLAVIKNYRKFDLKVEFFKYQKMSIYRLKSFDDFMTLIANGKICVSFKIGVYISGKRKGQIHNHGTSFQILDHDLLLLYKLQQ